MSDAAVNPVGKTAIQKPLPAWLASGILGLVLGAGGSFLAVHYYFGHTPDGSISEGPPSGMLAPGGGMGGGGMGGGGMGGGGMGGGGMGGGGMGGGGMGGGGMGGGGMGGGGGAARGKRNLTTLVGKLDLISKGLSLDLSGEQSAKLAAQLAELDQSENMTQDDAQDRLDALESILTDEQKESLAQFDMPRGGRAGGAGGMPPGGGGMSGGGGPPMGGGMQRGGGAPDDSNPFQEEANQSRLHSLVARLKTADSERAEEPAP
jgi:hypothetical protein